MLAPPGATTEVDGRTHTLSTDDDGSVWDSTDRGEKERVLLTTGSHHMQGYWIAAGEGALRMLPVVFARDEGKLIARRDAFVEPPDLAQRDVRWNSNCIACHATAGQPRARPDGDGYDTRVAELGVACEACHGPGDSHVARHHDPIERFAQRRSGAADPTIVNPARLPAAQASAVCGQCHAYAFPRDEETWWTSGYVDAFRPGQSLDASRELLSPEVLADPAGPKMDVATEDLFWPDGTVRVAGREYNAMIQSACFVRGEGERKLACSSCHSMHASDPDDMLRRDRAVQTACVSCHAMPENHSRHRPGSPGDVCIACHMPKTSYALRTAIRSHRIDVPGARDGSDRPSACNLCHLDRSAGWQDRTLAKWRGGAYASFDLRDLPESAVGLLSRDAAERVLWADAMGDADALAVAGTDWQAPLLRYAAERDPYAVVRYVAKRALRALQAARASRSAVDAKVTEQDIAALLRVRDDRDMTVAE